MLERLRHLHAEQFVFLLLITGCFPSSPTRAVQDSDIQQLLSSTSFLHSAIQTQGKSDAVELDKLTADMFLRALLPIKSVKKQHGQLQGTDYEFIFQAGRNPLWIQVDVSDTNNQLVYEIDGYIYRGGSVKVFLLAVEKAGIEIDSNE